MIPSLLSDEPWTRISPQYAEAREKVVEAVEDLVHTGVTQFTLRMVADRCRDERGCLRNPSFCMVDRMLDEMIDAGFVRKVSGQRGRPRIYEAAHKPVAP